MKFHIHHVTFYGSVRHLVVVFLSDEPAEPPDMPYRLVYPQLTYYFASFDESLQAHVEHLGLSIETRCPIHGWQPIDVITCECDLCASTPVVLLDEEDDPDFW